MKVAFIHDHIFPKHNNEYYESPGFDSLFFKRYLGLFSDLDIIARHYEIEENRTDNLKSKRVLDKRIDFCTFDSHKEVLRRKNIKKIEDRVQRADCVIIRVPSVIGLVVEKICIKLDKPYIVEVVGYTWDAVSSRGALWRLPAFIYDSMTKNLVNRSKYSIYVSEKYLQDKYPSTGSTLPCSDVFIKFDYSVAEDRKALINQRKDSDSKIIGSCGDLDAIYKNNELMIKAIPILNKRGLKVIYEIAGGGNQDRLRNIAMEYGVESQVKFLGQLDHEAVLNWLSSLDVYVHTSKQEGLCRAIVEAMSRGCPIIATDVGGIHEQINEEYIIGFDENKLAELIASFDNNKLIEQAMLNYENSKKYDFDYLNKRRNAFINEFIEQECRKMLSESLEG